MPAASRIIFVNIVQAWNHFDMAVSSLPAVASPANCPDSVWAIGEAVNYPDALWIFMGLAMP
jgi:hypothetical protein